MTTNDPSVVDLTAFDRPFHGAGDRCARPDPSELHILRLALDLQLDAMLLTLGASAHAETLGEPEQDAVPWRRWLVEDLDLARTLAATLLEGEAAPVTGLGGGFANGKIDTSLDNLVARYESMEHLLSSALDRPVSGQHWRGAAAEALHRCRARLTELHHHRRLVIASASHHHTFLPGELLG
ncbi:MAG TPA: hypothetical protein VHN80_05320 [Kineosporiaceae bacterium]|nr:hypothetical protein [Kineosporiaceae bacterium]